MSLALEGRRIVMGEGGLGLGRAVAEALVDAGARVLVVSRDGDAAEQAAQDLGDRALPLAADLASAEGVDTVVTSVAITLGSLDGVVVHSTDPPNGPALELEDAEWRAAFDTVLGSPIRLMRGLVPQLAAGGVVLFLASPSSDVPVPYLASSTVLSPAVAALAGELARQLAPEIRVNVLASGYDDDPAGVGRIAVSLLAPGSSVPSGAVCRTDDPVSFGG